MKNLFYIFLFVLFGAIGAFTITACVSSTPVVQYPADTTIAVVYSYDDIDNVKSSEVPQDFQKTLDASLTARNLKVTPVAFSSVENILTFIRDTERRVNALQTVANNANYLVLNEISTEFYSPLSGRYRWDVHAKMTIVDTRTQEMLTQSVTLPAVLMYSHETGADAIEAVQTELERRLDSLVDQFLKGLLTGVKTSAKAEAPKGASPGNGVAPRASIAENTPSEAIYFIMVDRFFNAQNNNDKDVDVTDPAGWHGGDLEGIRAKLPYLKTLGVTQLWLSPVFSAAHEKFFGNGAFHGYWTYDLSRLDATFGSEDDLKKLAQDAEKLGIGIILDFVVNHVGYGSKWVTERPSWFHPALTIEDWNDPDQLTDRQVHGLPDLDQSNPEVYNYLLASAQKWLSLPNITGYRLDAVKHVRLDFWEKFNKTLQNQKSGLMLLGEYYEGDPRKVDEVQRKGHFTHLFDFPLAFALRDVFCSHQPLDYLANILPNDRLYSDPNHMVTFIDNHDMPRFISICNGDMAAMRRAIEVMASLRGVPSFYYGTEVPLSGAKEPDNRADMTFDKPALAETIKSVLKRRAAYPVLRDGKTGTLHFEPDFLVIGRDNGSQQALLMINEAGALKTYPLPAGNWFDADTHESVTGSATLSPKSTRVLVQNGANSPLINDQKRSITFKLPTDAAYIVVGSSPELGQWNPDRAPRPQNGALTVELPAQSVIAYKLVRIDKNGAYTWANGSNKAVFTEKTTSVDLIW